MCLEQTSITSITTEVFYFIRLVEYTKDVKLYQVQLPYFNLFLVVRFKEIRFITEIQMRPKYKCDDLGIEGVTCIEVVGLSFSLVGDCFVSGFFIIVIFGSEKTIRI